MNCVPTAASYTAPTASVLLTQAGRTIPVVQPPFPLAATTRTPAWEKRSNADL